MYTSVVSTPEIVVEKKMGSGALGIKQPAVDAAAVQPPGVYSFTRNDSCTRQRSSCSGSLPQFQPRDSLFCITICNSYIEVFTLVLCIFLLK